MFFREAKVEKKATKHVQLFRKDIGKSQTNKHMLFLDGNK